MNPQQQQQQQVTSNLPTGVQEMYIAYSYYGRPRVMITLQEKPRRQLMAFAVILLVFGPIIIALVSACMAMQHFYLAYGFAAGILAIVTGCLGVWASKSNNPCAIRAVMALSIQCMIWCLILAIAAIVIAAVLEDRTVATVVLEGILAVIGLTGGVLCLVVTVFFCKMSCSVNYAMCGGTATMYPPYAGQQVVIHGQQQQMPAGLVGPPSYSAAQQMPANSPQQQPPSYDNVAADCKDKV